ncbi:hypothetical protein BCR36DRAFT_333067 [Piromyces finnis]|uniref:alcohol dehydrogenase n=1 Tax=Piromyces finnis TaxID=1754191 RepID=A0A1Y1V2G4_9FUNG|nr:hypothetical protein BCR36DRAFT_333067 [Piromyces finnis]|eukprot:ORX45635.1 hypothetical protein BCR36DRAFT_333067 [Piromyces finnis]
MIIDFTFYNPTKIIFGKNSLDKLEEELNNFGEKILFTYGGGSIKKNGIYEKVIAILNKCNKKIIEFGNVTANPTLDKMLEGSKLAKENEVDLILAVGGGSVIDCAKGISATAYCEGEVFNRYWIRREPVTNKTIPVASILTMVGTGSEMNGGSVIRDVKQMIKEVRKFPVECFPKFSILNPEFTFTVPKFQMVSGIFDVMSHLMEQYFSGNDDNTSDYMIEGLLKSVIHSAKIAIADQTNYEARSNIMWCATLALNTLVGCSKSQDWEVHAIEHQLGAYADTPHGMGLCCISMPYYRYIYKYGLDKFVRFAQVIWNVDGQGKTKDEIAREGIDCLEQFAKDCGMVTKLKDIGCTREMLPLIANSSILGGAYKKLNHEEILHILEQCYE